MGGTKPGGGAGCGRRPVLGAGLWAAPGLGMGQWVETSSRGRDLGMKRCLMWVDWDRPRSRDCGRSDSGAGLSLYP